MQLAWVRVELLGRSPWWIAICGLVGVALLAYGFLSRRLVRSVSMGAGSAGVSAPKVWGIPLPRAAMIAGLTVMGLTALLVWMSGAWGAATDARVAGAPPLLVPIGVVMILAGATVIFYSGAHGALTPRRRWTLISLRAIGMMALVLLLFRPTLAITKGPEATKPVLAVVIDASASMGYHDAPNQPNRYRQSVIAVRDTLLPRLEKAYRLELFAYDGKHAAPLSDPDELDKIVPDGDVTDLGAALGAAIGGGTGDGQRRIAGALLFSDGIHNGATPVESEMAKLGTAVPVHTVRVGSSELEPSTVPDIAVVSVDGPQTGIVNNQVILTANIKSTAMSDRTIRVMLNQKDAPAGAKPLDEQRLVLRSGSTPQTVQLKFTPDKVGRALLRVQVPVDPDERSDANNQQDFAMLVTDPKLGVLYVEGRVRREVGVLKRALESDPNLAAVSLVQTAPGRFEISGQKPADMNGLPTSLAQWKHFKVVILGDLDASFLGSQQQKDLEQIVKDGAGLLMIGGQNSFAAGGWDKTTLADLLPVSLEKITPAQINTPFVPELTPVGAAHPIFRNIASFFLDSTGKKAGAVTVPDLSGCVALGGAKAGATVLAVHPTEKRGNDPCIVLAVQQYGKGRTAAFAADTTFVWDLMLRGMQKDSPYNRFWGQLVRWLASQEDMEKKSGASVTAMLAKERFESGEPVVLRAAVTDAQGQATTYADVWADVLGPDGKAHHLPMISKGGESAGGGNSGDPAQMGIYECTMLDPGTSGTYHVTFGATKDKADLGKDQTTFMVLPTAGERDVLAAQPRTLETISRLTSGTAVDLPAIDALADRILASVPEAPASSTASVPLSRPRPFFLVFVLLLATEWLLRRRWQLQ